MYRVAIKSAEDFHRPDPRWEGSTAAERIVLAHFHMETDGFHVTTSSRVNAQARTYARVDNGRWICDCPFCPSAQNASRLDHRFFCVECGNAPVGGQWIEVVWPTELDRLALEEHLGKRHPRNMWWSPGGDEAERVHGRAGETVDDIARENAEHGIL